MVGAKVCDLTEALLWFVCGLYVGILTSSLIKHLTDIASKKQLVIELIAGGCKLLKEATAVLATCGIPCTRNGLLDGCQLWRDMVCLQRYM